MNTYSFNTEVIEESVPAVLDRKTRHRLLRKTDIIRAAEHVFALKGFHEATIQDIARQAQYATGTVYLYFADKDSLYLSIVEEKLRKFLQVLKLRTSQVKGARAKLEASIYESLRFFEEEHDFFQIFVREESCWSIKSKLVKSATAQERKEFAIKLMKEAQAEGVIRKDFLPGQVSDMLESIITAFIFDEWQEGLGRKKDLKATSGIIMDLFLNGVKKR
jgi:AcrR family transcriptional regulator